MIPGAMNTASACLGPATACNSGFCGNALVTENAKTAPANRKTICCKFKLCYRQIKIMGLKNLAK